MADRFLRMLDGIVDWVEYRRVRDAEVEADAADHDPWAPALQHAATSSGAAAAAALEVAATAKGSRPAKTFKVAAAEATAAYPAEIGAATAALLRAAIAVPTSRDIGNVPPETGEVLRGLVWLAAAIDDPDGIAAVADFAVAALRKIPDYGALCHKAGTAAVAVLGASDHGAPHLGAVRVLVKDRRGLVAIDAAIDAAAARLGLTREAFLERLVPDEGLEFGRRSEPVGAYVATVEVDALGKATLTFADGQGKTLKSVPAAIKAEHPECVAGLRGQIKQLTKTATAQRHRLEGLLREEREWPAPDWRAFYWEHGLMGVFSRLLIWEVRRDGSWSSFSGGADGLVDASGAAVVMPEGPDEVVRLWHPVAAELDDVVAWRTALLGGLVRQPFKQAHREVYVLTDAERATEVYSNRFAAHVVKQHQFNALCRERGWEYQLLGAWDGGWDQARLPLPESGLDVVLGVDRPWEALEADEDAVLNEAGVFNVVTTDDVSFRDRAGTKVPLEHIPPKLLSEVFRDVDLFVGVCSVGNDPNWVEQGERTPYGQYWQGFAFGELSQLGETRRALLAELLPKLAIADRLSIDGRFLRVQGRRGAYKIHLGSTNILMEPGDRYLCIVPRGRSRAADAVFLPFAGDGGLQLLLSKAFLLAADDKITDPVILEQLR